MPWQFTPYRWEPVMWGGYQFRVTFMVQGALAGLKAEWDTPRGGFVVPFVLSEGVAELVLPAERVDAIPDRAAVRLVVDTGKGWELLAHGHVIKRQREGV